MTANQYENITKPFMKHKELTKVLLCLNKILTYMCYIMYPLLLLMEFLEKNPLWIRSLLTAGISFVLVTLFRGIINRKRPYEALEIMPLIKKETKGKSFPSRHVFSVFVIALCWLRWCPVIGIFLLVAGILMAFIRVIGGVHYPLDVVVGALIGVLSGLIGMFIL